MVVTERKTGADKLEKTGAAEISCKYSNETCKNKSLRRKYASNTLEEIGGCRKLHKGSLHNWHFSSCIIRAVFRKLTSIHESLE